MLTNSKITFFGFNKAHGKYENCGCHPAWVQKKERIKNSDFGVRKCDRFDVRVSLTYDLSVTVGDLIYFGEQTATYPELSKCVRISGITKNNFGSEPHWHFEAENEYR